MDKQREMVYNAEHMLTAVLDNGAETFEFFGSLLPLPATEKKFGSVEAVQSYVDAVLALNWVQALSKHAAQPVSVRARKGRKEAHYEPLRAVIAVPDHQQGAGFSWAMREVVVLHELAHHLTRFGCEEVHGPEFAGTLLVLIKNLIGDTAGLIYMVALTENGAKFTHYNS
jgi:putative metallohydrolase (TIGR04338 family)